MARATDEVTLPAGKVLCEQGTIGREAFVIVDGTAEVRRNKKKVATLGPGTCVGRAGAARPRAAHRLGHRRDRPHGPGDRRARVRRHRRRDPVDRSQADEVARRQGPGARHPGLRLTGSGRPGPEPLRSQREAQAPPAGHRGRRGCSPPITLVLGDHGHRRPVARRQRRAAGGLREHPERVEARLLHGAPGAHPLRVGAVQPAGAQLGAGRAGQPHAPPPRTSAAA